MKHSKKLVIALVFLTSIAGIATAQTVNDQIADFTLDSQFNNSVTYDGSTYDGVATVDYTVNQSNVEKTSFEIVFTTTDSEGTQVSFFKEVHSLNGTNLTQGETYTVNYNLTTADLTDTEYSALQASGGTYRTTYQVLEYTDVPSTYEVDYSDDYHDLTVKEDGGLFYRAFQNVLNWFNQTIIDPIVSTFEGILNGLSDLVDQAVLFIADVINAIGTFLQAIVNQIIVILMIIVNGIISILDTILVGIVNTAQFLTFYNIDIDYEVNNTTYDNFNNSDIGITDALSGNLTVVSNRTQTDEFDSSYSLNESEKSLLTYKDSISIVQFGFDDVVSGTPNIGNSTGVEQNDNFTEAQVVDFGLTDTEYFLYHYGNDNISGTQYTYTDDSKVVGNDYTINISEYPDSIFIDSEGVFNMDALGVGAENTLLTYNREDSGSHNQSEVLQIDQDKGITFGTWWKVQENSKDNIGSDAYKPMYRTSFNDNFYVEMYYGKDYYSSDVAGEGFAVHATIIDNNAKSYCQVSTSESITTTGIWSPSRMDEWRYTGFVLKDLNGSDPCNSLEIRYADTQDTIMNTATTVDRDTGIETNSSRLVEYQSLHMLDGFFNQVNRQYAFTHYQNYSINTSESEKYLQAPEVTTKSTGGDSGYTYDIELDYPKAFDPLGLPVGTITIINLVLVLIGFVYTLIPNPIREALNAIFNFAGAMLQTAVATLELAVWFFNWIFEVGLSTIRDLLILIGAFIGLQYVSELADAYHGQQSYVTAVNKIIDDVLQKVETIERMSYRAFHTVTQLGDVFFQLKQLLIEIYTTIKNHIPVVG